MTMESLAGVRGVARRPSTQGNTGDPRRRGGGASIPLGMEPCRKSERRIVPAASAGPNQQGGKEPWFAGCLTEFRIERLA